MRYLLDTHSFLWFITGNGSLSQTARALIESRNHSVFVSVACLWEIAIKSNLGKLALLQPYEILIPDQLSRNEIELLPITVTHLSRLSLLPYHHRDPFDRLIIAQSQVEALPIITKDMIFNQYDVTVL